MSGLLGYCNIFYRYGLMRITGYRYCGGRARLITCWQTDAAVAPFLLAALYYEEAYAALVIPPLQNHFERSWLSHVQLKAAQFNAEACYRYAIELHDKMEIGEEIARLQFGINAVVDAKRTARGAPASLYDSVSRLEQDMNQNLEKAVNENNRIYLMRVPAAKLLSPLPSASLVRSASKSEVLDAKAETGLQSS
ncbi:unnamed protein product [Triticum turgidum subsp. durum]|uniref:BRO1 domain-containing protein n=1 Tax=Triticum turgidum subsp. durum TaxID=4567 RepID=A0A9R1BBT1_TRITD|nr:unnamed protein product [Triticum turgidum subsp. durum]